MDLNLNIIFIIYFGVCIEAGKIGFSVQKLKPKKGLYDCYLPMSIYDYNMPIPFTLNTSISYPTIIRPNRRRYLRRRHLEDFNMACAGSYFVSPKILVAEKTSEIMVQCQYENIIAYKGKKYEFDEFRCESLPQATMKVTREPCQDNDHIIAEIGFQTNHYFLKLYSTCFDMKKKNVLYTWYIVQCPIYQHRQAAKYKMNFSEPILFDDINPAHAYRDQANSVGHIINSTLLASDPRQKIKGTRFLVPGILTSKNSFPYAFEQHATFYYENTAPQWHIFNDNVWKHLEKILKISMTKNSSKQVIVTGTYGTCTLPTEESFYEVPLHLLPNGTMTVPLYIWKLSYDLTRKKGVVYIGLNNPYRKVTNFTFMCNTVPCPEDIARRTIDKQLLYCCTKEAFEMTYGKIDLTVFRETEFIF